MFLKPNRIQNKSYFFRNLVLVSNYFINFTNIISIYYDFDADDISTNIVTKKMDVFRQTWSVAYEFQSVCWS